MRKVLLFFFIAILFTPAVTSAETYWKRGMAIGAGAGAGVGLGVGLGVALGGKCSGGGENECGNLKWVALAGFPVFGAIVGTGIGTLIGACIKKDEAKEVSVEPYLMPSKDGIAGGLNMRIAGW